MQTRGSAKRYLTLFRKLQDGKFPTRKELIACLEEQGFKVSPRTLKRDLEILRDEYGLEIKYDNNKKGYSFANTQERDFQLLLDLLELKEKVEHISTSYKEASQNKRYISFERNGSFKGMRLIPDIVDAIKQNKKIRFLYLSFQKDEGKRYELEPLLVVENRNRWYVIGYHNESAMIRMFGLDRIEQVELGETIKEPCHFDYDKYYQHTFGVTYLFEEPQQIVLSFLPELGKYIKTLPIHHSQKILVDNQDELRVELYLVMNMDLERQLLSYGNNVKVIEPWVLAEKLKENYRKALEFYN